MTARIGLMMAVALVAAALAGGAPAQERPNVVVILADDLGYADVGFHGATDIRTPHLDELAASGVVFTSGYCNHPFCAPSRAALLSGRYQQRFGFEHNPHYDPSNPHLGIDPSEKLFPARLRDAGYKTGGVGKWHLGAASPFHPVNRGFDYFYGFLGGGHDYFRIDLAAPLGNAYLSGLVRNRRPASFDGYLTTALSTDAAEFIDRNHSAPFFLYVSYNAPHSPLQAPKDTIAKYRGISDLKRRVYAAMVDEMDQGIGVVLAALERNGIRDNTLVFFLSDNGGPLPMSWNKNFGNGSSNAPLRGGKTNLYEGGVRVPFVASWPAQLPAGRTYDSPVIALDIARTAVELSGGDADAAPPLEGVNLVPYLTGEATGPPHETLFWRDRDGFQWAMRTADGVKCLIDNPRAGVELFDLAEDRGEQRNQSEDRPDVVSRLRRDWARWDAANTAGRIMPAHDYTERRDAFYRKIATGQTREPKSGAKHP